MRPISVLAILLLLAVPAAAVEIVGTLTNLSDDVPSQDRWRATYQIQDWTGQAAGHGVSIEVPTSIFSGGFVEQVLGGGAGWQLVGLQVDPNLPAAGLLDARSTTANPSLAEPFHIDFVWEGAGASPDARTFYSVYDASFAVVATGVVAAPEPAAPILAGAALLTLAALARRSGGRASGRSCGLAAALLWIAAAGGAGAPPAAASTVGVEHSTSVGSYDIKFMVLTSQEDRISQTQIEYPVLVTVTNLGSDPRDFSLTVSSGSASTQIVAATMNFAGLAMNQSASSQDLVIRQDRRFGFDPAQLSWELEHVTAPVATLRIVNNTHYDMIDIRLNNQQFVGTNQVLPIGNWLDVTYDQPGTVNYNLGVGFWDNGFRNVWYTLTGSTSVSLGQVQTVTFNNPTIGQVLALFGSSHNWSGPYYDSNFNSWWARFNFSSNGTWRFYDSTAPCLGPSVCNFTQVGSGSLILVSWPDYSGIVTFKICPACDDIQYVLFGASFLYENGPPSWPIIEYTFE